MEPTEQVCAQRRKEMVERQIRSRGIRSENILRVLGLLPRERFLPPDQRHRAYEDRALPLSHQQTLSQPYMVAIMTEVLDLTGDEKVLEVGTGSGYQTAVLSHLSREVYSVERIPDLLDRARITLEGLGVENVRFRAGDGTLGWEEHAPFDRILVTAGAPDPPPPSLLRQLSPEGGILVVPVGGRNLQELLKIKKRGEAFEEARILGCRFVPLVGEEGWETPEP